MAWLPRDLSSGNPDPIYNTTIDIPLLPRPKSLSFLRVEKEIAMTDISSPSVPASQNSTGGPATPSGPHVASMSITWCNQGAEPDSFASGPRLGPPNSASEIQATTRATAASHIRTRQ